MNKAIIIKCLLIAVLCGITATGQTGHSSEGKIIGRVIERETLQSLADSLGHRLLSFVPSGRLPSCRC